MDKAYNKIVFVNNQEPDLDATNMNAISNAIDEIDNRVIALNETVEQDSEVIAQHTEAIAQNTEDIEALKKKPSGITLTSASPLLNSAAAGIAGLQAKGKSEQHISKNLYDTISNPIKDLVYNAADNEYRVNGETWKSTELLGLTIGKSYVLSADLKLDAASSAEFDFLRIDKTSGPTVIRFLNKQIGTSYTRLSASFECTEAVKMTLRNAGSVKGYIRNIQINEGSTALPYEPFTGTPTPTNPIPIVDASGVVTAHMKNLCQTENTTSNTYINIIPLEVGKSYTISATMENINGQSSAGINVKDGEATLCQLRFSGQGVRASGTFTAVSNADKLLMNFWAVGQKVNSIQIEEGTTASDYVPYQSNEINLSSIGIDLRSIPNTNIADTLTVNEDGSAEWVQKVGVENIGSLNWAYESESGRERFYTSFSLAKKPANSLIVPNAICSKLVVNCPDDIYNHRNDNAITIHHSQNELRAYASSFNGNVTNFKNAISDAIMYYELATPIVHTLTKEQVAAILTLQTYAGTTIVESELDDVVVDYVGDTKGYIDSKFEYLYELIRSYHPEAQMMSLEDEPTAEEEESENV